MEYCAITGDGVVASGEIARLGGELRDGLGVGCACLSGLSRKLSVRQGLPQTLPPKSDRKGLRFFLRLRPAAVRHVVSQGNFIDAGAGFAKNHAELTMDFVFSV